MTAFEAAVIPLRGDLYGSAMRLTKDPLDAEDLLQDTLLRAHRGWHTFQPGSNVKAWVFTILRNTFINDYHRKARRRELVASVAEHTEAIGDDAATASLTASRRTAEDQIDADETLRMLTAALERLPDDYRTAVTLADLEGLSYREIAEIMDCPIGTVMSRIYRGRKLLRARMFERGAELGLVDETDEDDLVRLASKSKRERPSAQMSMFGGES